VISPIYLAGEKCSLKAAVSMCLKLLQSYEKSYTFDKFPSVQELNKKKRKLQKNQRLPPTNTTTDNQGTSLQVPVQVAVRKGKTLRQYIENCRVVIIAIFSDHDPDTDRTITIVDRDLDQNKKLRSVSISIMKFLRSIFRSRANYHFLKVLVLKELL
jgi:hypothetical protein